MKAINEGQIKALFVLEDNIAIDPVVARVLERLEFLIVNSSFENETTRLADVTLPSAIYAEKNGTFTNFEGRVQRIRPSVTVLELDRSLDGFAMSRLDKFGSQSDRWAKGPKLDARPHWKIVAGVASLMGAKFRYNTAEDVFSEISSTVESFKGMSYQKIGNRGMMLRMKHEASSDLARITRP